MVYPIMVCLQCGANMSLDEIDGETGYYFWYTCACGNTGNVDKFTGRQSQDMCGEERGDEGA